MIDGKYSVDFVATDKDARLPTRATPGSIGYDLAVAELTLVPPGAVVIAPTRLKLADHMPLAEYVDTADNIGDAEGSARGMALLILPRSSLAMKYGLMIPNSPGLVDTDYSGEIGVLLYNFSVKDVILEVGTRIAQAVFVTCHLPNLKFAERQNPDMTRQGFGSTGA